MFPKWMAFKKTKSLTFCEFVFSFSFFRGKKNTFPCPKCLPLHAERQQVFISGLSGGPRGAKRAQLGVWSTRNAASVWLLVAWLKSFNPCGVESPAGALTSLHLLPLSL